MAMSGRSPGDAFAPSCAVVGVPGAIPTETPAAPPESASDSFSAPPPTEDSAGAPRAHVLFVPEAAAVAAPPPPREATPVPRRKSFRMLSVRELRRGALGAHAAPTRTSAALACLLDDLPPPPPPPPRRPRPPRPPPPPPPRRNPRRPRPTGGPGGSSPRATRSCRRPRRTSSSRAAPWPWGRRRRRAQQGLRHRDVPTRSTSLSRSGVSLEKTRRVLAPAADDAPSGLAEVRRQHGVERERGALELCRSFGGRTRRGIFGIFDHLRRRRGFFGSGGIRRVRRRRRILGRALLRAVQEGHDPREQRAVVVDEGLEHGVDLAAEDLAREVGVLELAPRVRRGAGSSTSHSTSFSTTGRVLRLGGTGRGGMEGVSLKGGGSRASERGQIGSPRGRARRMRSSIRLLGKTNDSGRRWAFPGPLRRGALTQQVAIERFCQVDESPVQGFALLDGAILLEELLQREALLVEHELSWRTRAGRGRAGQSAGARSGNVNARGGDGFSRVTARREGFRASPRGRRRREVARARGGGRARPAGLPRAPRARPAEDPRGRAPRENPNPRGARARARSRALARRLERTSTGEDCTSPGDLQNIATRGSHSCAVRSRAESVCRATSNRASAQDATADRASKRPAG